MDLKDLEDLFRVTATERLSRINAVGKGPSGLPGPPPPQEWYGSSLPRRPIGENQPQNQPVRQLGVRGLSV
jgi:hypothetical protein